MHGIIEKITKQSNDFFIHLVLILISLGLSVFILTDDYLTPVDTYITIVVIIALVVAMLTSFVFVGVGDLAMPLLATLVMVMPLSIVISDISMVYLDDCTQINKINSDISIIDCINFIIDNPDSTGMQVIDAFEQEKKIETDIDTTILNRQFNP